MLRFSGNVAQARAARLRSPTISFAVRAPKVLGLFGGAYAATSMFLNSVRKVALRDRNRVVLDLRRTEQISPEMAPLLQAEIQRIKFIRGANAISGISPVAAWPRRTLHAMGFFDSIGMYDPYSVEVGDDLRAGYRIVSGTALDGELTRNLANQFADALRLTSEQAEAVQKAFNEALENISEHAYYDPTRIKWQAERGRWWICAITSPERQGAFVLACDLGMTIPATVQETASKRGPDNVAALARYLADRMTLTEDERLLGAAFQDGVTRRAEGKGGNGLGKMAALVGEFPDGHLHVLSGGAIASITKGRSGVAVGRLSKKFPGTFVLWHLAQEKLADDND